MAASSHQHIPESGLPLPCVLQRAVGLGHGERLDHRLDPVPGREGQHLGRFDRRPGLAADDRF